MKGGSAAMLTAMAAIHRAGIQLPGDMVFACVAGGEVLAHQRNESVEIESLLAAQRFYAMLPSALFGLV
jgi:acetylornithine deacetylase/succinyl-diaminopimelate desuccinylase-like protein